MDSQPENFDQLRHLLALKRHEQPPPGYFDRFSREVFLHLQAGESQPRTGRERVEDQASWLMRLWESLSLKPILTGGIGVAACAMVVAGVLYAERPDLPTMADNGLSHGTLALPPAAASVAFSQPLGQPDLTSITNTSLDLQMPGGLFGPRDLQTLPASGRPSLFRNN